MMTRLKWFLSLAVIAGFIAASAWADSLVYVTNFTNQFGTVDLSTGAFAPISNLPSSDGGGTGGMVAEGDGSLLTLGVNGDLFKINPPTGAATDIGPTGLGGNANMLAGLGGVVYATDFSNNLYKVNTTTGVATKIGATGMPAFTNTPPFSMNADGSLNLVDESLTGAGGKLYATFDSFTLDSSGNSTTTKNAPFLWQIDPSTGLATLVGSTADHITSAVNVDGTVYGFEGTINTEYNFFNPGPLIQVVTLDLTNGDTSFVSDVDPSAGAIFAASPVPAPEPASIALFGSGLFALAVRLRRLHG